MAFVQSLGSIETIRPPWSPGIIRHTLRMYDSFNFDYATLYRTQPNVRTCVDFLSRNIAQLGLHVFRRISDNDRERLTNHPLAQIIKMPLPPKYKMTEYRLKETIMGDLGIYFNAYLLKIRQDDQLSLLPIPPIYVTPLGELVPRAYRLNVGGLEKEFSPDDIVHFRGYNPENPTAGLAPLETLRRILAEEYSSGQWREGFWKNKARMEGIIKRPQAAPEWSEDARKRFMAEFAQLYSGEGNSGNTAVLEEGMEWQQIAFNARESEYLAGRKLTREECARAYHIPLPMVGILDHATFSNIEEQHKNLYQDAMGPWLVSIQQDFELQLLPEFADVENVYVEFNIAEKLRGSFADQVKSFQAAVGRPWMTANEARGRMNLNALSGDADSLVTPLNVIVGGQASPQDSTPPNNQNSKQKSAKARNFDSHYPELRANYQEKWTQQLQKHYRRQERAIIPRIPKGAKQDIGGVWYDNERWNNELMADLIGLNLATASEWANLTAAKLGTDVSDDPMIPYIEEHSRIQATYINDFTRNNLEAALREPDPVDATRNMFDQAANVWAVREAITAVTSMSSFGTNEAARAGGLRTKTWNVNSSNPRPEHIAMAGETVGIRETFSNGMRWPGDPAGGADQVANCQCSVSFS